MRPCTDISCRVSFYREPSHIVLLAELAAALGGRKVELALVDEVHVVARAHAATAGDIATSPIHCVVKCSARVILRALDAAHSYLRCYFPLDFNLSNSFFAAVMSSRKAWHVRCQVVVLFPSSTARCRT